ncbi:MAG: type I DNA topoisomerase [candidate division Zixibacteria bacterium]|nr:type I DNA topoisomerase [candidate division Zixibacteria bacterium]
MSTSKKTAAKKKKKTTKKKTGPDLLVVESPTKTKTLKKFLGRKFKIMATKGHIIDLPKSRLGVDIDNDFEPRYIYIRGKKAVVDEILKEAKKARRIFLAPDPDREGEAIAWHLLGKLDKVNGSIHRVVYNELTKKAVQSAIETAGDIDDNKVMAQQARRILDRLVGYQVSPILWKTVLRGLSAGRVQSVALKIICEREEEVENFEPQEFWKVQGLFTAGKKDKFTAALFKVDGEDFLISSQEESDKVCADISKQDFSISSVKKEEKKRNPMPPYITSTLQQDASNRLRFATQKTMYVAQQLYEGVDLGDAGSVGLISYMRTDSVRISEEALQSARQHIAERFGEKYLPEKARRFKTKKSAQDAHEAIRPTSMEYPPEKIKQFLTPDQYKLYSLIYSRFLASQMNPAIYDSLTVEVEGGRYLFRVSTSQIKFDGFMKIYKTEKRDNGNGDDNENQVLPELEEGHKVDLKELDPTQHFTKPPPRFTEASLVRELEQNGIGRPSTYSQIISTIKNRKYIKLEKRKLMPTDLGKTVNRILIEHFEHIFNVDFTSHMEEELDKIEEGKDNWVDVLREFYKPFSETLETVEGKLGDIKQSTQETTDEVCEKCGSAMVIKWGRNGRFLACSAYPECKNTKPLNGEDKSQVKELERDCPKCGNKLVLREGKFGRFIACSTYPNCDYTEAISTGVKCSAEGCPGTFVERRSRRGKPFFGCSEYPKCTEAVWYRPIDRECPECGHYFMFEKKTKKDGLHLKCPKCNFILKLEDEEEKQESAERLENAVK